MLTSTHRTASGHSGFAGRPKHQPTLRSCITGLHNAIKWHFRAVLDRDFRLKNTLGRKINNLALSESKPRSWESCYGKALNLKVREGFAKGAKKYVPIRRGSSAAGLLFLV